MKPLASASEQIKLIAMDSEDLDVISAVCQDGVLKVSDLDYLAGENRFLLSLNRFVWEKDHGSAKKRTLERRRSVLHFEHVSGVKIMGINRADKEMILSLLAIRFENDGKDKEPSGEIELVFAGDGAIRLTVECIEAQLTDLGAAWQTKSQPSH